MTDYRKPDKCPFCGSYNIIEIDGDYNMEGDCEEMHGYCDDCHAHGPGVIDYDINPNSAIEAWNRREEPEDIPGWMREKIRALQDSKMDKSDSYFSGYIHATQDILRLRREDAE